MHRGAVAIPLDPQTPEELFFNIYKQTTPSLIICDIPLQKTSAETITFSSIKDYKTLKKIDPVKITPEDAAEIVFTSGTTSEPKGVVLTHGNILSNLKPFDEGIEKKQKLIKLLTPFRILCTVPYSHMFGQLAGIFLPILLGSTIYFAHETGPASLIRAIRRDRILTLIAVPRVLKLLFDHVKAELTARGKLSGFERRWDRWEKLPYPLRAIIFFDIHRFLGLHFWSFIVGGAPLDADTHEFWRRLVYSVLQGYGLTETAPMVTMFNPFRHNRSSVGKVLPGQEVKIGADGEILVKGENVMAGYYNDPKSTASVIIDGWFRTGDIGSIDKEGHVYIKGRKKEMIVTSDGHNVYPKDIEKVLNSIKGVREGVVIGLPEAGIERIHAVLLLEPGADPQKCIKYTNAQLLPYQRIREYTVWHDTDFPRTSTLKIRKAEILKKIQSPEKSISKSGDFVERLLSGTAGPDSKLVTDLGMNSLDVVEAVSTIEKKYNISIDESLIGPETTVRDLEALAAHPSAAKTLSMPRWARRKPVKLLRRIIMDGIILSIFRIYCRMKVHGLENLKYAGVFGILAANHASDLDPLAVLSALPIRLRSLIAPALGLNRFYAYFENFSRVSSKDAASEKGKKPQRLKTRLLHMLYGFFYFLITFLFQAFPFPQGTAYRGSLEYIGELLDAGYWILIFPEGEVSSTGELQQFRGGISVLAKQTGAPVFPVAIKGMNQVLPPGRYWPRRNHIDIYFGKPLSYDEKYSKSFTEMIENAVRDLKK
ncbi:2-succinylbenzoate--CoA ligase [subsurface metagenome]